MTGRVFVVQRPAYFDRGERKWVDKYDLSSAEVYGELIFLLNPGNIYRDKLDAAIADMRKQLADFGPGDHIMAVGDPVAIAVATLIASEQNGGSISLLKYDRINRSYASYEINSNPNKG